MRGNSMRENRETQVTPSPGTDRRLVGRRGTVGERQTPYARHARCRGVGRFHSTREAGEQNRVGGQGRDIVTLADERARKQ
jgi:hypothetical protein